MAYNTIISTEELASHLDDPNWLCVDCRFSLDDVNAGRQGYLEAHIPGAVYAHLDDDLSGPILPSKEGGRHPLPTVEDFAQTLSNWGIDSNTQVIAYDTASGVIAGRLWWMLRWLGHDRVAVLDGDFRHWIKEGRPTSSGEETRVSTNFVANPQPQMQVSVDEVEANLKSGNYQLYDVRSEARYRGGPVDPASLDAVSGHIPGAISAFYGHNLGEDGKYLSPKKLRERYADLLDDRSTEETVWYCGSGVSVHHDLLALEIAGFARGAKVYIGSWSDWSNAPTRPIETV